MESESNRATKASESRFRLQAPNSRQRRVAVVSLDPAAAALADDLAKAGWNGATFYGWHAFASPSGTLDAFLADLGGRTRRVTEVVEGSELVVLIAGAREADAAAVAAIGDAATARRVTCVGVLLAGAEVDDATLSAGLSLLRPHVGMLVVAEDRDYVAAMLEALRA